MEVQSYRKQTKQYYPDANRLTVGMELSILSRLRYYIAENLYGHEIDQADYTNSIKALVKKRIIPSNMNNDFGMRSDVRNTVMDSNQNITDVKYFSNNKFPFTIYNLGEAPEVAEESKNTIAALHKTFIPDLGSYVSVVPIRQTFEFISFFNTAQDYDEAMLRFNIDNAVMTRVDYPILLNGTEHTFYFDLDWEVAKGEYTEDFETYLEKNKIYDIVHNAELTYMSISSNKNIGVYPVTDMAVSLYSKDLNNLDTLINTIPLSSVNSAITFGLNFTNGQTGYVKTDPLIFTFNSAIVEASFVDNFSIDPKTLMRFDLSPDCTTFTITPFGGSFLANTLYTITIPKMKIRNEDGFWYKDPITITFTTGA